MASVAPEDKEGRPSISRDPRISVEYQRRSIEISNVVHVSVSNPAEKPSVSVQEDIQYDFHTMSPSEILGRLDTNLEQGLQDSAAAILLQRDGPNVLTPPKPSQILRILGYFFSGFGLILFLATILAFISYKPLGNPNPDITNLILACVLVGVILFSAAFNAWQDHKTSQVLSSIQNMMPSFCLARRNGQVQEVPVESLVVGDIVMLSTGNQVPADLRFLQVSQMKLDKAAMTGESEPISCTTDATDQNFMETRNLGFLGTNVIEGSAVGVVVATGNTTVMGKLAILTSSASTDLTSLQKEIRRFVIIAASFAFLVSLILLSAWLGWLRRDYPGFLSLSGILLLCLGSIVAFVPEGLPICVTLTLTLIAKRMLAQRVLVKNLPTVETLGSINTIASDKTGTLTQNKMTVAHIFSGFTLSDSVAGKELYERTDSCFRDLVQASYLCNRAFFDPATIDQPIAERKVIGDASDTGLFNFTWNFEDVTASRAKFTKLGEIPFNSRNKWMMSVYRNPADSNRALLLMKGAPEIMVSKCSTLVDQHGQEVPFTDELRKQIFAVQEQLGSNGERVLAMCRTHLEYSKYPAVVEGFDPEDAGITYDQGLCFIGMLSLMDAPRPEVKGAIDICKEAHVRVMMVTGDHPTTALAIARMVGIVTVPEVSFEVPGDLPPVDEETVKQRKNKRMQDTKQIELTDISTGEAKKKGLVIKGADIPKFQAAEWDWVFNHQEIVFARTTPEQKLQIVKQCQARGGNVAVTGDGVNDAPALKQANVGVAMGGGSDVAREAADIVLLDNNFSSIVVGIEYGRLVFANLRKVIIYLLPAGSWSELMPVLANVFLGLPLPLSAFLMIYICVLTDIMPSLSMVYETAESNIMKLPPRDVQRDHLVDWRLLVNAYLYTGIMECLAAFVMYFWYMKAYGGFNVGDLLLVFDSYSDGFMGKTQYELNELLCTAQTVYFVALVMVQFGNLVSCRTNSRSLFQHNPFTAAHRNWQVPIGMACSLILAILIVFIPPFNWWFNTRIIPAQFWFAPLAFSAAIFCVDELRKFLIRKYPTGPLAWLAW